MFRLTKQLIKRIEYTLEPGSVCELQIEGDTLRIYNRPPIGQDIDIDPVLLSAEDPTTLRLRIIKAGEEPIHLSDIQIKPGFWLAGLKGYISQEIAEGE